MIFSGIVNAVGGIASAWMQNKVEQTKAKGALNVAMEQRKTKMATGEIDWDQTMAEASKDSWKDEWLTVLFSIPLVLAFIPGCEDIVQIGFGQLQLMPDWYKYALSVIVAASFGVRSATKLFGKRR